MGGIIFGLVVVIFFLIVMLHKYYKQKTFKENIAWCVLKDNIRDLIFDIYHIQSHSSISIEKKYRLGDNDSDTIREIIRIYQQELIEYYFKDYEINFYKLSKKAYFFYTLNVFLEKHEDKLTQYGMSYHKLYYISQMYVINLYKTLLKKKPSNNCIAHNKANATKKLLDKGDDL